MKMNSITRQKLAELVRIKLTMVRKTKAFIQWKIMKKLYFSSLYLRKIYSILSTINTDVNYAI